MASFLRLNGIPVPVLDGSAKLRAPEELGQSERAVDGSLRIHRRAIKQPWDFSIAHQVAATALAFRDLLLGKGQTWGFDSNLYGSKGTGPSAATNAVQGATAKYGAGGCTLTATSGTITWIALPLLSGGPWTVSVWRKVGAGAWVHYLKTSAGSVWTDGVLTGSTAWLTVTTAAGAVKIDADAASTTHIDDLVVLPYAVPSDWPASIHGYGAAFSPLARLYADGLFIEANSKTVTTKGEVGGAELVQGTLSGSFAGNLHVVQASLIEV